MKEGKIHAATAAAKAKLDDYKKAKKAKCKGSSCKCAKPKNANRAEGEK
jgi:hypothetical protein